jgi:hypothetical protein
MQIKNLVLSIKASVFFCEFSPRPILILVSTDLAGHLPHRAVDNFLCSLFIFLSYFYLSCLCLIQSDWGESQGTGSHRKTSARFRPAVIVFVLCKIGVLIRLTFHTN